MKKRIAILVEASIFDRKGLFNAVFNRCINLKKIADYEIDLFLLSSYKGVLSSVISKEKRQKRPISIVLDGLHYSILWRRKSIIDYLLYHKLGIREFFHPLYNKRIASKFYQYDLLDVHSGGGETALEVKRRYGIPYVVSWHGSDIHTAPYHDNLTRQKVAKILENADCNFFVSNALKKEAENLGNIGKSEILYNGVSEKFRIYSDEERISLRNKYFVNECKVVAFVGNIIPIKNPESLVPIFSHISKEYNGPIKFWVIGDGELRRDIEINMIKEGVNCVFWGNQSTTILPEIYQCIDVLVIPSRNEGLALVAGEAINCGANVIGTRVGGIPEVIGENNCVSLEPGFEAQISRKVVCYLVNKQEQTLPEFINWKKTAALENKIINRIISKE